MKAFFATLLMACAPALVMAQSAQTTKPAGKATAKPAAKKAAAKPAAKPALARSAQKAVEERTPIDDDPQIQLSAADIEVAKQVYVGDIPCELGASVKVAPMRREGFFLVTTKNFRFRMHPVESRTGAIRLEDAQRGAMWLQLGNKSMLMSQKLGQRLADECQSPQQVTFAEALKKNPLPSILEPHPARGAGPMAGGGMHHHGGGHMMGQPGAAGAGTPGTPGATAPGTAAPAAAAPAMPAASAAPAAAPAATVPAALAPAPAVAPAASAPASAPTHDHHHGASTSPTQK